MKTSKRKTIPEAPSRISKKINQLAEIRTKMKALAAESKRICVPIIAFGSCHNDKWRAYVAHHQAGFKQSYAKARVSVVLKPMNKDVPK